MKQSMKIGSQAVIPNDKSRTGGFIDLADEIEDLMLATTDKWLAGEDVPDDKVLHCQISSISSRLGNT